MKDWRLPEHRREAFMRFYLFHLKHKAHPGMVYSWLPALAEAYDLDADQRAWLVWLNGNTQNPVTSQLLLDVAPRAQDWRKAAEFVDENFKDLAWDTDRRYFKSKFGKATEQWVEGSGMLGALAWDATTWSRTWRMATRQPYMGRLSAWSMIEYARILLGERVPDAEDMMLKDDGSRSHRNGLALVAGHDSVYWKHRPDELLPELEDLATELLDEAALRNGGPDVSRLTLESALCTYKGWHKPRRRYPGVYADMAYDRLLAAEARWGHRFEVLWAARQRDLPEYLRLEDNPGDPGCVAAKQDHYRLTGQPIMMHREYPDMKNDFNDAVDAGRYGIRKDWSQWLTR